MKKLLKVLAAVMLIACLSIGVSAVVFAECHGNASYDSIVAGETLTIACEEGVNLRTFPGSAGKVIVAMPVNTQVYVLNKVTSYVGWLYVTYGDVSGYAYTEGSHGHFFSHGKKDDVTETDLTKDPNYKWQATVTASSLTVRNGYYITSQPVGYLGYGRTVEAIATTSNGWVKVRYISGVSQTTGYVSGNYVKLNKVKVTPDPDPVDPINEDTTFAPLVGCVADSVNEDDLQVFASPKTYANVDARLDEAEMVFITAKAANGLWYQINYYDRSDDDDDDDDADISGNSIMETGYVKAKDVYVYRVFDKMKMSKAKTTLTVGKKKQLSVVDKYNFFSDIRMFGVTVKYKSSDRSVVKVNKKGVIKGINPGTAVITARAYIGSGIYRRGRKLTCRVTVK